MFRDEVKEQQTQRLHGNVVLLPKTSVTLVTISILVITSVAIALLFNGNYSRKETVKGWIKPINGLARVYGKKNGVIHDVKVKTGDFVSKGESLVIIDGEKYLDNGKPVSILILDSLESDKKELQEQIERAHVNKKIKAKKTEALISSTKHDIFLVNNQLDAKNELLRLTLLQLDQNKNLVEPGFVSKLSINKIHSQIASIKGDIESLKRIKSNQISKLDELTFDAKSIPNDHEDIISQLEIELSKVSQSILQYRSEKSYTVTAPISGYIQFVQANIGHNVQINKPLVIIVPDDTVYEAELLVPVSAAGFIEKKQPVSIRYDAFPYQKFGIYRGVISKVETTVILPDELDNIPVNINSPVYRVKVNLDQDYVYTYGNKTNLKSGMTLESDIVLEERSLIEWVLSPVMSIRGRFDYFY